MPQKILVIEDLASIRELLEILLTKKGYAVSLAENAEEGIDAAKKEDPDLVLIDRSLPDADGLDVLKKIREFDKRAKIFMLSGLCTEEAADEARALGASGYLDKNAGMEAILKAVSDALA
jgi:DNA-binding response OmpR family regulator